MVSLDELDLRLTLENAIDGEHFDRDEIKQGTSLQPVDMIFEFENYYLFVEIKDPDIPGAANPQQFRTKLQSGQVIHKVAGKFRDTTFFRWSQKKTDKQIIYIFLLSMASLDAALLSNKQEALRKSLPSTHSFWGIEMRCIVMNVDQWRRKFGHDSLIRISEI